jgi:hypothetical protein
VIRVHSCSFVALVLACTGCGYVGGPLTPLANIPTSITDLAALQRGPTIYVHFSVPRKTTENFDIQKPLKLDLRIGTAAAPFNADQWAEHAKEVTTIQIEHGIASCQIPSADWVGKDAIIAVRAFGANGKATGWSNYGIVPVIAPPPVPGDLIPKNVIIGVHLRWSGHGDRFRIMRRTGKAETWTEVVVLPGNEWTDNSTEYGTDYTYELQALVDVGNGKVAESDFSEQCSITPKDEFAPAVPAELRAVAAVGSIELVWERNTEPDFAMYRIYRAIGDGPFEKLADAEVPSYSDRAVEAGKIYRYTLSALDKTGNESERSGVVQATAEAHLHQ